MAEYGEHTLTGFEVFGPFPLRDQSRNRFSAPRLREFWNTVDKDAKLDSPLSERPGCYIFGLKSPRALTPWYVGKTFASFRQEVFQPHKKATYWEALHENQSTPVWFFVPIVQVRGRINQTQILQLEGGLIWRCQMRNPHLLNKRGKVREKWVIHGYDCGCPGRKSAHAQAFISMVGGSQ